MSCVLFWLWRRVVGGVRECSVDGVGGAAPRSAPSRRIPRPSAASFLDSCGSSSRPATTFLVRSRAL